MDFILKMMDFILKMMDFILKMMDFILKMMDLQPTGTLEPATAKLLLSNYGKPQGNMAAVSGKTGVYERKYEKATITLDCATFAGTFAEL